MSSQTGCFRLLLAVLVLPCLSFASRAAERPLNEPPPGFEALFNGKDLDNWRGQIAEDPRDIAKITEGMTPGQVRGKQQEADRKTFGHWTAKDGAIYYDGTRRIGNIETREHFGDFEMYIDWKIPKGGDSGIFPRNMPQVQIWDPAGGQRNAVGSGGLDNNGPNVPPATKADRPVGQWNTFYIKMVGDKIWVTLNGETVIDGQKKGNHWKEYKEPPPEKGPIVLQSHGSELWFRNVFIRRLDGAREECGATGKHVESRVLQEAFVELLAGMVVARRKAGDEMPPDWKTPQFVPRMFEELKKEVPGVFRVTPEQEERFRRGEFNGKAAAERISKSVEVLQDFDVELPGICRYIIGQHRAGKLEGAKQEMVARILSASVSKAAEKLRQGPGDAGLVPPSK